MSRIIFQSNFTVASSNFKVMYDKHTLDGTKSVLNGFLLENEIDLTVDEVAYTSALLHEENRQHYLDITGSERQLVENNISVPWNAMLKGVQFLKLHYKDNVRNLVAWGIPISALGKIAYPTDEGGKLELVDTFWSYQGSLPVGKSPLDSFITINEIDVPKILTNIANAKTVFASLLLNIIAEQQETGERDRIWAPVWKNAKSIGGYLMKLYVLNTKMVCNWGFNVVDAGKKQSLRTSNLILGSKIVIIGNVLGSTLSNLGTDDLHIYRGKTTIGTPIVLKAGGHLGIIKGFSNITVVNPSVIVAGKFSTMVRR